MQNFKVIKTENSALHSVSGILKVLSETDGWKQKVELWLLNDITNNNDWRYERLEEHRHLFAETPILVAYVGNQIGDGHNFQEVRNPDGSIKASFMSATAERIVGFFRSESDIRMEVKDGKKWVVGTGYIWKWYAQELVEKIKQQGLDGQPISIETLIDEMHKDGSTEVFTKYQILGTTILGDDVNPAVSGANIRALSEIGAKGLREMTIRVASEQQNKNNPQNQNSKKENKIKMKVRNLDDLRSMFSGYTVLAVNGQNVALLSEKGRTCSYVFRDDEDTVVPERITEIAVNSVFGDSDDAVLVSADQLVGVMKAQLNAAQTALEQKTSECASLTAKVNAMEEAELARRKKVITDAIKSQLAENKAIYGEEIADNLCDDMLADAQIAEFATMEKDGEFYGDECARERVDARCMRELRKATEKSAKQRANQFTWVDAANGITKENNDDKSIDKAIENILK